jgi:hypothetical protein
MDIGQQRSFLPLGELAGLDGRENGEVREGREGVASLVRPGKVV